MNAETIKNAAADVITYGLYAVATAAWLAVCLWVVC
jgi:hypothetical protein